ncbi:MAG: hypothetical protein ABIE07_10375 [Candidatus Zixiibacteriota bacterium]
MAKRAQLSGGNYIELSIRRLPAETEYFCQGFYQIEEDVLYVPIYPSGRFYSYLDSIPDNNIQNADNNKQPLANLDIDHEGRLVFLQIKTPRRQWKVNKSLKPSPPIELADVRFISFREKTQCLDIETDQNHSQVRLTFSAKKIKRSFRAADNLIFDLSEDNFLVAIWIISITDDRAAKLMSEWRKAMRINQKPEDTQSFYKRIEINK